MNSNSQRTKRIKMSHKMMTNNKAKTMAQTPMAMKVTSNLHHNHWRPKTTQSSK